MNIVILDAQTVSNKDIDLNIFSKYGNLTVYNLTSANQTAQRIKDANIIICNKTEIGQKEIDHAPNLKFITLFATGYNNIDVEYCAKKGIVVSNAGNYSTNAVAQHTFGLILELMSKIGSYNNFVQSGGWINTPSFSPFVFPTDELAGKTLGIFGLGEIGKAVADIALAFKMNVISYSRTKKHYKDVKDVDFDELLSESDILSIHSPLNAESKEKFTINEFNKMKKSAYLINTARGAVCNESDLSYALNNDIIAGAGIDVLSSEPMNENNVFMNTKNVVITPHVAWAPLSTRQRLIGILCRNIECFIEGKPQNKVN